MESIIVYEQSFHALLIDEQTKRNSALIQLILNINNNELTYIVRVNFKEYINDCFKESNDYMLEKEIYRGITNRNNKREEAFLNALVIHVSQICDVLGGNIYYNQPITKAKYN